MYYNGSKCYIIGNKFVPYTVNNSDINTLFSTVNSQAVNPTTNYNTFYFFSKTLNSLTRSIPLTAFSEVFFKSTTTLNPNHTFYFSTLKCKDQSFSNTTTSVILSEAFYKNLPSITNSKTINTKSNLSDIQKLYKNTKNPNFIFSSLETNLNTSKQQRWLAKNSLLSELITSDSFLLTQSKKLIGSGVLDNSFTGKNLWLPTKLSKSSSLESTLYLSNMLSSFNSTNPLLNYTKLNTIVAPNFLNLNFFENSRFWLFKKYYFSVNHNIITEVCKTDKTLTYANKTNYQLYNTYFHYNTYLMDISHLIKNTLTPSLQLLRVNNTSFVDKKQLCNSNNNSINKINTFVKLNTPYLDVLNSHNINFLYTITSNPQTLSSLSSTNTKYFNVINSFKKVQSHNNINFSYQKIQFTIK
jgi:hypothetical protein